MFERVVFGGVGGRSNVGIRLRSKCLGIPVLLDHDGVFQIGSHFGDYDTFVG